MANEHVQKPYEMIRDLLTGQEVPNVGAEENRQKVIRFLIEEKGYGKSEIRRDMPLKFKVGDEEYATEVDLVVFAKEKPVLFIKTAAASIGSCEREAVAAARILFDTPMPWAVVTDGEDAVVLETEKGKVVGEGMEDIPDREASGEKADGEGPGAIEPEKLKKERLIFRTYDSANVNVARNIKSY